MAFPEMDKSMLTRERNRLIIKLIEIDIIIWASIKKSLTDEFYN